MEKQLKGKDAKTFFKGMYGNEPNVWNDSLKGIDRYRFIINCFTRLRYCNINGHLALKETGPPGTQPPNYLPWFQVPHRRTRDDHIIFGHWATLGYSHEANIWAIDSGCVWGGKLTALRLDSGKPKAIQIDC